MCCNRVNCDICVMESVTCLHTSFVKFAPVMRQFRVNKRFIYDFDRQPTEPSSCFLACFDFLRRALNIANLLSGNFTYF